jgi:23S rRNA (cytosine1962-C5)-methyltransferase
MTTSNAVHCLERAWQLRNKLALTEALRVFHGPGEGEGPFQKISVDRFGQAYWITVWDQIDPIPLQQAAEFYRKQNAISIVFLERPKGDLPPLVRPIWGEVPDRFSVTEGHLKFWIRFKDVRHPGLFLDHWPLREWLKSHSQGLRVLNTFSYTGSLSIAAMDGGAHSVTTLDLSGSTIQWAKENWSLNSFPVEKGEFIAGDFFEFIPRWKRQGRVFDLIILDPPSSSRSKRGHFSTAKDLVRLHEEAMGLLSSEGFLVTSINSHKVAFEKFENDILKAAAHVKKNFLVLKRLDMPETFPTRLFRPEDRYLKGLILKAIP